ncbi:hypothetical protein [Methylobacterium gossipiicola]|uniref:Uncharacterized protein n=1 Tax=Methylobacterium gossipiicola TaxID=582675 RepID=A0A1I2UUI9_9HYPH|nr:hypothetical protein [Methylobacterium gossipiicola]SFG79889.1 hypothetical protein SAMN05192565_111135 [Methylobacterium gossipiicola]
MTAALSDRQRIELALPAYLLFVLTSAPGIFTPHDSTQMDRAEADISGLCTQLRLVSLEPFADLTPKKRDALVRRLQRIAKVEVAQWKDQSAILVMLKLRIFLDELINRQIVILWEGTPMDWAIRQLTSMSKHGFDEPELVALAHAQAAEMLISFQKEGFYLPVFAGKFSNSQEVD